MILCRISARASRSEKGRAMPGRPGQHAMHSRARDIFLCQAAPSFRAAPYCRTSFHVSTIEEPWNEVTIRHCSTGLSVTSSEVLGRAALSKHSDTCRRSLLASVMDLKKKVCSCTPLMPKVLLILPTPSTRMSYSILKQHSSIPASAGKQATIVFFSGSISLATASKYLPYNNGRRTLSPGNWVIALCYLALLLSYIV